MSDISPKYFYTHDIFLSSTLATLGFKIEALNKQNKQKVEFSFKKEKSLEEVIQRYWAHELCVEPQTFAANLKSLKNRIYSD